MKDKIKKCKNCKFFKDIENKYIGLCKNNLMRYNVTERKSCCGYFEIKKKEK